MQVLSNLTAFHQHFPGFFDPRQHLVIVQDAAALEFEFFDLEPRIRGKPLHFCDRIWISDKFVDEYLGAGIKRIVW